MNRVLWDQFTCCDTLETNCMSVIWIVCLVPDVS